MIGLIVGLFIGGAVGIVTTALCTVASRADRGINEMDIED